MDANVLESKTLRDWLYAFYAAGDGLFELYSSEDVVVEAAHAVRKQCKTMSGAVMLHVIEMMKECVELVEDYDCEHPTPPYLGADEDDRHVHAAAVASGCEYLLTDDDDMYPDQEIRDGLPYCVIGSDDFFCMAAESSPMIFGEATQGQINYWQHRSDEPDKLSKKLREAKCPKFAYLVERVIMRLAGLSPAEIDRAKPLGEEYSLTARSHSLSDLQRLPDDIIG